MIAKTEISQILVPNNMGFEKLNISHVISKKHKMITNLIFRWQDSFHTYRYNPIYQYEFEN